MDVILLERIAKLGQMGDVVRVKDGFARNFLLPQGKALRANARNRERFEQQRAQLEAQNLELKQEAEAVGARLDGQSFVAVRQAGDTGQLYGSVSTRDIAELITEGGFTLARTQVNLNAPIKTLGLHRVAIALHPEVEVAVTVNVARSEDEAERQARGEDLSRPYDDRDDEESEVAIDALFEDEELAQEAAEALIEGDDGGSDEGSDAGASGTPGQDA